MSLVTSISPYSTYYNNTHSYITYTLQMAINNDETIMVLPTDQSNPNYIYCYTRANKNDAWSSGVTIAGVPTSIRWLCATMNSTGERLVVSGDNTLYVFLFINNQYVFQNIITNTSGYQYVNALKMTSNGNILLIMLSKSNSGSQQDNNLFYTYWDQSINSYGSLIKSSSNIIGSVNLGMSNNGGRIACGLNSGNGGTGKFYYSDWNGSDYGPAIQITAINYDNRGCTLSPDGNVIFMDSNPPTYGTFDNTLNNFTNFIQIPNTSIYGMNNFFTNIYMCSVDGYKLYWNIDRSDNIIKYVDITYNSPPGSGPEPSPDQVPIVCFKENSKILCLIDGTEKEMLVQDIRNGVLVKTSLNGYLPVKRIGTSKINNPGNSERILDRLYLCSQKEYPELNEDLVITGAHAILVNELTQKQREETMKLLNDIFITDDKYRLLAHIDERAIPYEVEGKHNIYHIALENENIYYNYGIYANGLLVESCSIRYLTELSNMTFL
jgi:hypothetical protein